MVSSRISDAFLFSLMMHFTFQDSSKKEIANLFPNCFHTKNLTSQRLPSIPIGFIQFQRPLDLLLSLFFLFFCVFSVIVFKKILLSFVCFFTPHPTPPTLFFHSDSFRGDSFLTSHSPSFIGFVFLGSLALKHGHLVLRESHE